VRFAWGPAAAREWVFGGDNARVRSLHVVYRNDGYGAH
jgi:hypothetical protein